MDDGLRARKKRETRRRLTAAAIELVEVDGVDAVTVADIAERAGVSRRTFFNYFATKEEALVGSSAARNRQVADLLAARPADEAPWAAIRHAVADLYATEESHPERSWVARVRLARSHPSLAAPLRGHFTALEGLLAEVLAERLGIHQPDIRPDLRAHLLASLAITTIRVAVDRWIDDDVDGATLPAAVDAALALAADDLLTAQRPAEAAAP